MILGDDGYVSSQDVVIIVDKHPDEFGGLPRWSHF